MKFYSQNGEDFLLWSFFGEKKKGFFVDIGAFDGVHLSNSYIFEKAGWDGVCVDAHPFYFEKCKENRPGSICIHAACVGDEGLKEVVFHSEELGLLSGIEMRHDIKQRYEGRGLKFDGFKKTAVPAKTVNAILKSLRKKPDIDFVSIDVEGHELEILRGFDLDVYRPRVLVIEANTEEDEKGLDSYLTGRGYQKARRVVENVFYCRDAADAATLRAIDIKCDLVVSEHPLGRGYNPPTKGKVQGLLARIAKKIKG